MANKRTNVTHGRVLDDPGFSSGQAAVVEVQGGVVSGNSESRQNYSQKELQILGEPQPRVSELLNGKTTNKSSDKLPLLWWAV